MTPADLLPGVVPFLAECADAGLQLAVVAGSQNDYFVLERLAITERSAVIVAGPAADVGPGNFAGLHLTDSTFTVQPTSRPPGAGWPLD